MVRRVVLLRVADFDVAEDVCHRQRFAACRRDVDAAGMTGVVGDIEVLTIAVRADFQPRVGKAASCQHDAVALCRVVVADFARLLPAGRVVAIQQEGEGIRARAAGELCCAVAGGEGVVACAAVLVAASSSVLCSPRYCSRSAPSWLTSLA